LSGRFFDHPMVVPTANGLRYPTLGESAYATRGDASHRDQVLACLAELGVSLTTKIIVNGRSYPLQDVLADSVAEFHLGQKELAWTAIAYSIYLAPGSEWRNKYGESFGFNDLVSALLSADLRIASCGGTHCLWAMSLVEAVDHATPMLVPGVRRLLKVRIAQALKAAVESQHSDGSWSRDWHKGLTETSEATWSAIDSFDNRLLVTGHLAEWLQRVPDRLNSGPQRELLARSLENAYYFLKEAISEASAKSIRKNYCHYTHAYCVVYRCQE
jgi:hypothetical protein